MFFTRITFNNKNAAESIYSSNVAKKEIADENKNIINMVKTQENRYEPEMDFIPSNDETSTPVSQAAPTQSAADIFADFNF